MDTGRPGLLRLFTAPLSKEASWLLPLALVGAMLLVFRSRLAWPIAPKHQALVLWGGWLLLAGGFFSVAGFFHPYYLSTFAPPVAVLAGIGAGELWRIREKRQWLGVALILIAGAATLLLQFDTALAFVRFIWWLPIVISLFLIGALLLTPFSREISRAVEIGFACLIAALLLTPTIWSGLTMLNPSSNQSLPAAYDGQPSGPSNGGAATVNQRLLDYLEINTQGVKYLIAVPSSMQGSDYVIATGRPVLYLGGFMGVDQVATATQLANLVANGELRYVYWDPRGDGGFGGGRGGPNADISSWVTSACKPVPGFETSTQNSGAPDGTGSSINGGGFRGGMQISLYDCG